MDDVEDVTPLRRDSDRRYDLGPISDEADAETYRRWMIDVQRMNNRLMKRILYVVTGGSFQDPPSGASKEEPCEAGQQIEKMEPSAAGERRSRKRR